MTNRITRVSVACLLSLLMLSQQPALASSKSEKEAIFAEKIKAGITKLGVGESARVKVKLRNRTSVEGYISEVGESSFVVTDLKSASATTVPYPSVVQVKGNNLSTGAKIAIGVAIAVGVAIVLYMVKGAFCDGC